MTDNYDVIIIGPGTTGENVADRTQKGGLSTVIIESELGSGECSYWACMPTKALLQAGEGMRGGETNPRVRDALTGEIDVVEVLARRTVMTSDWDVKLQAGWLESVNVPLIRGHAKFIGPK